MKVVIAGSRRLGRGQAPRLLVMFLDSLFDVDLVLLRSPMTDPPGPFEQDVAYLCDMFGLKYEWIRPEPTADTPGRTSVYVRDMVMAEKADLMLLFFMADEAVEGYSGTSHLLYKALAADRPVYAYALDEQGKVTRVGEYDPENLYADRVPQVP